MRRTSLRTYIVAGLVLARSVIGCGGGGTPTTPQPASAELPAEPPATYRPPASREVTAGEQLLASGDHAGARRAFEHAVAADPRDARAQFDLGLAAEELDDPRGAAAGYRGALADERFVEPRINLANLLRAHPELRDGLDPLTLLREATTLAPRRASAWSSLALAEEDAGDDEAAIAAYDHAVELAPRDPVIAVNRALVLARYGRAPEALVGLENAERIAENSPAILSAIGTGYRQLGRLEEAARLLTRAIDASERPSSPLLAELALVHLGAHDRESAVRVARAAVEADGQNGSAHFVLGVALRTNDVATARTALARSLELDPEGPHAAAARRLLTELESTRAPRRPAR